MIIQQVISGGQTGVDQAALRAARVCGITTGGWAPKGWRTHAGPAPWLAEYGLVEHYSPNYRERTLQNVRFADATLILGNTSSPGSSLTKRYCVSHLSPYLLVPCKPGHDIHPYIAKITAWIAVVKPRVLNVAGNREETNPGIGQWAESLLTRVLRQA